ncbi:MAG: glycosyltransferase family 2 protein [Acidimicrobiia bacterium]|nr:glycosyltransferase family 2 protein [Acidimicrobiia bacterium]
MGEVTAVIPNWNGGEMLARVLEDLVRQSLMPRRVIVVDNASTDGSADLARSRGAEVLAQTTNTGFARAVNLGISQARTPYVAILNNDVELAADWLETLLQVLEQDTSLWFATGKIYRAGGKDYLDGSFDAISRGGCAWRCGHGRKDGPVWNRPRRIHLAPFTAILFRRASFERAGLLDEQFESYLEDVDFGLRCARAGLEGQYEPRAVAYHWGSATLGEWNRETVRRMARNRVFLLAKHFPRDWQLRFGWPVMAGHLLWCLVAARHGRGLACLRGIWEGVCKYGAIRHQNPAEDISCMLEASEATIRELQRAEKVDWYWKLYFALT